MRMRQAMRPPVEAKICNKADTRLKLSLNCIAQRLREWEGDNQQYR